MLRHLATLVPRIPPGPFPVFSSSSTWRPIRRCPAGALAWLVVGAGAFLPALPPAAAWGADSTLAAVVRVSAGDALVVETADGVQINLRLFGIQAPKPGDVRHRGDRQRVERVGQPFSEEAKQALEELVLHQRVRVELYGRDFFRYVRAVVFLGAENVNVHMVRGGLARVDRAAHRLPEALRAALEQAEAEARRDRRGLWMFE